MCSAGPGPRGALATLAQYMGSSAATFAFFMSIGSVSVARDGVVIVTALVERRPMKQCSMC